MSNSISIQITLLRKGSKIPQRQSVGAAGYDLYACLEKPIMIYPNSIELIPTGIAVAIPPGYEIQIRPRSGLSLKNKLLIINSPGTIDSDYRGEIFVPIYNLNNQEFTVEPGLRIAQMILAKVETIHWDIQDSLPQTERASGGFGSSGLY